MKQSVVGTGLVVLVKLIIVACCFLRLGAHKKGHESCNFKILNIVSHNQQSCNTTNNRISQARVLMIILSSLL